MKTLTTFTTGTITVLHVSTWAQAANFGDLRFDGESYAIPVMPGENAKPEEVEAYNQALAMPKAPVRRIATVEAEYGKNVLEGEVTLAHHVDKYKHNPAPCATDVEALTGEWFIVVSHLDLDTIGGLMALLGIKPEDKEFWDGAGFIDCNGPHHVSKLSTVVREKLEAYWAWNASLPRGARATGIKDLTKAVLEHAEVISKIISGDEELIAAGQKWVSETSAKVEACLIEEDAKVRVFATDDVFCSASYYSPNLGVVVPATVVYNTKFGSITIANAAGEFVSKVVMQELFGPEAGGHVGIAGSPRGKRMTLADFVRTVEKVRSVLS